jgi:hypothetical protein
MSRYLLCVGLALSLATPALAQGRDGPPRPPAPAARVAQKVDVQLRVVHATDAEAGVDPRLSSLSSSFRYFKYKGYKLLSTQNADIAVGGDTTWSVEGGRRITVSLLSFDEARARMRVQMTNSDGKILDTTVNINRNGTFIISGPRYKDGILMLPVTASY